MVLLLLTLIFNLAPLPSQIATPRPHRFPVEHVPSASEALKEYEGLLKKIKSLAGEVGEAKPDAPSRGESFDCPGFNGSTLSCVGEGELRYYVGAYLPYVTNSPVSVPSSAATDGGGAEPGWVPAENVVGGQTVLKRLEDLVKENAPGECDERSGECEAVVEAIPSGKGERALAVCDVAKVGEETGAVRNCEVVAIVARDASFIRSVVAYRPGGAGPSKPDVWGTTVEYHIERGSESAPLPSTASVLNVVREVLGSDRLSLRTELISRDDLERVVGVADARHPLILEGVGLEKVTALVDTTRDGAGTITIKASFSAQVYGGKGARTSPEDFRLPDSSEMGVYGVVFDSLILQRLPLLCSRPLFKDLRTLVCHDQRPDRQGQPNTP